MCMNCFVVYIARGPMQIFWMSLSHKLALDASMPTLGPNQMHYLQLALCNTCFHAISLDHLPGPESAFPAHACQGYIFWLP